MDILESTDITQSIRESVAKELQNIPGIVKNTVQASIFSILGIKKDFGRYELDRSNGRNGLIANTINQIITDCVKEYIKPMVTKEFEKMAQSVTFKKRVLNTIIAAKEERINYEVNDLVQAAVRKWCEALKKQLSDEIDERIKQATAINTNLLDPEAFAGEIGDIILKFQLEHNAGDLGPFEED